MKGKGLRLETYFMDGAKRHSWSWRVRTCEEAMKAIGLTKDGNFSSAWHLSYGRNRREAVTLRDAAKASTAAGNLSIELDRDDFEVIREYYSYE
jgi:hypothetical protein